VGNDTKLKVVYHEGQEAVVTEMRGQPNICKDCRFSGWLTQHEFREHVVPVTCLLFSGGADPRDGDRVMFDLVTWSGDHKDWARAHREQYPKCRTRNKDGACESFLEAKKLPWWQRLKNAFYGEPHKVRRRMRE